MKTRQQLQAQRKSLMMSVDKAIRNKLRIITVADKKITKLQQKIFDIDKQLDSQNYA